MPFISARSFHSEDIMFFASFSFFFGNDAPLLAKKSNDEKIKEREVQSNDETWLNWKEEEWARDFRDFRWFFV